MDRFLNYLWQMETGNLINATQLLLKNREELDKNECLAFILAYGLILARSGNRSLNSFTYTVLHRRRLATEDTSLFNLALLLEFSIRHDRCPDKSRYNKHTHGIIELGGQLSHIELESFLLFCDNEKNRTVTLVDNLYVYQNTVYR